MIDTKTLNAQRLAPLMPKLIRSAYDFIGDCADLGVNILVTQGLRSWSEQNALYAQGRLPLSNVNLLRRSAGLAPISSPENGLKVTNASGGQSYHNFGLAFDIVPVGADGKAIWNTDAPEWKLALSLGNLHAGSVDSRLDPAYVLKVIGQDLELAEGANFHSIKDMPHFETTGGVSLQILRSLYKPNDLSACWSEVMGRL